MNPLTDPLSVLEEINVALEGITETAIQRENDRLSPLEVTDTVVGLIHNDLCKRLFVLSIRSFHSCEVLRLRARDAETKEAEAALLREAGKVQMISQLAGALFHCQVRLDLGEYDDHLRIRSGWTAVLPAKRTSSLAFLLDMLEKRYDDD